MVTQQQLANRRRFIAALKKNTPGYKQAFGTLRNRGIQGEVCALGMGLDEFGLSGAKEDPYNLLADLFGLDNRNSEVDPKSIRYVYHLNDKRRMSFEQIAEHLESVWQLY